MDIKDLINGLLDFNSDYDAVCDENKELITENKALKEKIESFARTSKRVPRSHLENLIINEGKKNFLEHITYGWSVLKIDYDKESDSFTCQCYQEWLRDKVCNNYLPESVSFKEFITYFEDELHAMYEREKATEIELLKNSMKEVKAKENE